MRKIAATFLFYAAKLFSYLYSYGEYRSFVRVMNRLYSAWISREFRSFGHDSVVQRRLYLVGGKYISVGNKACIGARGVLTAWDKYGFRKYTPVIKIGDRVSIGDDCHITAINSIEIGDDVLTGKKITITDNSHGETSVESLLLPPTDRPLHSRGPVVIECGVWIGDKVTILPNVRVGRNSVIGANSVVTKDVPANSVVGGIPAKVIKLIQ